MSLNVYFNAAPLLSPKTGIGQYCLNLMSELENISGVDPHYFYGGVWSDELLRQAPTSVSATKKFKRTVAQVIPISRMDFNSAGADATFARALPRPHLRSITNRTFWHLIPHCRPS